MDHAIFYPVYTVRDPTPGILMQHYQAKVDAFTKDFDTYTRLDYLLETIAGPYEEPGPRSLFQMLFWILHHNREDLEKMRVLIQKCEDKARVTQAFMDYARKGKLLQVTMLFLAAPELFSSALVTIHSEKRTDVEERLPLLLDVFATVGDMLAAYIRLEETAADHCGDVEKRILLVQKTQLAVDFFLRQATLKKLGVASPGYYMRFHVTPGAVQQRPDDDDAFCMDDIFHEPSFMFCLMDIFEKCKDFDQDYIHSLLPRMKPDSADRLQKAIKMKLSSMPPLVGFLKHKVKKPAPKKVYYSDGRSSMPAMPAFCTSVASARIKFDFNSSPANSLGNKMLKPTLAPARAMSIFSRLKLSNFPMIVKRLIK